MRPGSRAGKGLLTEAGLKFYSEDYAIDGAAMLEVGSFQLGYPVLVHGCEIGAQIQFVKSRRIVAGLHPASKGRARKRKTRS